MEQGKGGAKRILVIDDSASIGRLVNRTLSDRYEILVMSDGTGLERALSEFQPDLVILDIGLPWINGFDLCGMLRKQDGYKNLPVIFLSGRQEFVDIVTAMEAGATRYLTKPIGVADLRHTVDELVDNGEAIVP